MIYIFYDGNKIGEKFEKAFLENNLFQTQQLSNTLASIHASIKFSVIQKGGWVLEHGGDEGLLAVNHQPSELMNEIDAIWRQFGLNASVGAGVDIKTAWERCQDLKKKKLEVVS